RRGGGPERHPSAPRPPRLARRRRRLALADLPLADEGLRVRRRGLPRRRPALRYARRPGRADRGRARARAEGAPRLGPEPHLGPPSVVPRVARVAAEREARVVRLA